MVRLILGRLAAFALTLLAASAVLFVAVSALPGSAARAALGIHATAEGVAVFEAERGLDRPLVVQYGAWLKGILSGDFGTSLQSGLPVGPDLLARLPVTLELALLAFLVANILAIPLGIGAGVRRGRALDRSVSVLTAIVGAMPSFLLATLLIALLTFGLGWLPPGGYTPIAENAGENLRQMLMPALALGIASAAVLVRIMRAAMIDVMGRDYIRTAVAKGASPGVVVRRHALRNAMPAYLNVAAVEFGFLFGSVVIIEDIFLLPGVGSMVLTGVLNRDYPVLLAGALTITVFVLVVNLVVDIVTRLLDPRRASRSRA